MKTTLKSPNNHPQQKKSQTNKLIIDSQVKKKLERKIIKTVLNRLQPSDNQVEYEQKSGCKKCIILSPNRSIIKRTDQMIGNHPKFQQIEVYKKQYLINSSSKKIKSGSAQDNMGQNIDHIKNESMSMNMSMSMSQLNKNSQNEIKPLKIEKLRSNEEIKQIHSHDQVTNLNSQRNFNKIEAKEVDRQVKSEPIKNEEKGFKKPSSVEVQTQLGMSELNRTQKAQSRKQQCQQCQDQNQNRNQGEDQNESDIVIRHLQAKIKTLGLQIEKLEETIKEIKSNSQQPCQQSRQFSETMVQTEPKHLELINLYWLKELSASLNQNITGYCRDFEQQLSIEFSLNEWVSPNENSHSSQKKGECKDIDEDIMMVEGRSRRKGQFHQLSHNSILLMDQNNNSMRESSVCQLQLVNSEWNLNASNVQVDGDLYRFLGVQAETIEEFLKNQSE